MSSDLIAWVVAVTLGVVVVVLGLRRNLSETTRNGMPRFGGDPERGVARLGLFDGEERGRRPLSSRQRRWLVAFLLLVPLTNATLAVLSAHDRLLHASNVGLFALSTVFLLRQGRSRPSDGSAS